jgi:hypothetical protein
MNAPAEAIRYQALAKEIAAELHAKYDLKAPASLRARRRPIGLPSRAQEGVWSVSLAHLGATGVVPFGEEANTAKAAAQSKVELDLR